MRSLVLVAALAAGPAFADLVARTDTDELRLMRSPCVHAHTLGRLKPEFRAHFKKAQADIGGHIVFGCWIALPDDGAVWVLTEGGDGLALPLALFKDEPGV